MSLTMPGNASKPQELAVACGQTCPCGLGGETEQIQSQSTPPWTPGVHAMASLPPNAVAFETGREYSEENGVIFGGCGPAPTLPCWIQSSSLPISPMEASWSIVSAGDSRGSAILVSHHVTTEDSLAVGVHGAVPQHWWQLFPWGTTLKELC